MQGKNTVELLKINLQNPHHNLLSTRCDLFFRGKEETSAEGDKATKAEVKTEDLATQEKSEVKTEKATDEPKTEEGTEVKTEIKGEEEVVKDEPKDLDTSLAEEAPLTDMKPPPTVAAPSLGSGFVINISR